VPNTTQAIAGSSVFELPLDLSLIGGDAAGWVDLDYADEPIEDGGARANRPRGSRQVAGGPSGRGHGARRWPAVPTQTSDAGATCQGTHGDLAPPRAHRSDRSVGSGARPGGPGRPDRNTRRGNGSPPQGRPRLLPYGRRCFAWDELDLAHFLGYAFWNCFALPALLLRDDVAWMEASEGVLVPRFPAHLPTHGRDQRLLFDRETGLLRRYDYRPEVVVGAPAYGGQPGFGACGVGGCAVSV
jgi:hypothetical protein